MCLFVVTLRKFGDQSTCWKEVLILFKNGVCYRDDVISPCLILFKWVNSFRCIRSPNLVVIVLLELRYQSLSVVMCKSRKKLNSPSWSAVLGRLSKSGILPIYSFEVSEMLKKSRRLRGGNCRASSKHNNYKRWRATNPV